jgi:hypothetical protein
VFVGIAGFQSHIGIVRAQQMAVHSALGQQREGKTIHSQLRHSTASWIFSNNSAQKCEQRSITSSLRRELRFPFTFQSKASQL